MNDKCWLLHISDKSLRSGLNLCGIAIGMNVSDLGELSWKTDVFGVLGEFRSEFRSASAPLAQSVEQRTFNPQVLGSSPRGRTNWLPYIW